MASKDKQLCEEQFLAHFNMTRDDLTILWRWFMEYGMTKGQDQRLPHQNKANHYFLQEICQYYTVDWPGWNRKMTEELKVLIEHFYPQLKAKIKKFEWL